MAPQILRINSKGSALLEAIPVCALIAVFVMGVLAAAYLIFAQAWVGGESERALYCLAENRAPSECRRLLRSRIASALPWGEIKNLNVSGQIESWNLEMEWEWNGIKLRVTKKLEMKGILKNRVLQW